ncbi:MAG: alkaline phosphatase family protein [Candidatus Thermoplasmatota archaeon]|nr:alkaline phosphatase family protein [Candidatus Thermoplasmatota archaeon]
MSDETPAFRPEALELAERLAEPRLGPYPVPHFDGHSLPNAGVSAFAMAGGKNRQGLLPELAPEYLRDKDARTAVVFLVDSFGWNLLRQAVRDAESSIERSLLAGIASCAMPMTTVFPSTTSSALVSLSTGTAPGTHGIVGHTEYLPAWGAVLNMLRIAPSWGGPRDLAAGKGFRPADLVTVPTLFRRGLESTALTKLDFEGTAFTRLLYEGAAFQGYLSLSDLELHLRKLLTQPPARRPRLLWVYWDLLDAVHHLNGPLDALALSELTHLFASLVSVARKMSPQEREGISVFVTGDHGQMHLSPDLARSAHGDAALMSLLHRPPSGEKRAAFLEAGRGKAPELRAYLRAYEKEGWSCFPVSEILEKGVLGPSPLHPELKDRLGDFLLLPPEGATLFYRPPGSRGGEEHFLHGNHGGLTQEELLVPLVSTSLDGLARWLP